ncbi:hypothetical protein EJB05_12190, partial [Eragrostis curvula]
MLTSPHDTNPGNNNEQLRVQPHLLPSARLWKNSGMGYPAHGLQHDETEVELEGVERQTIYGLRRDDIQKLWPGSYDDQKWRWLFSDQDEEDRMSRDSEEHRRSIAACIVRGVYIMEKERDKRRTPRLAPAWWESFHFRCCEVLNDRKGFIFGAIFEYAPPDGAWRHQSAPRYVVAFRGTMPWQSTRFADLHHDLKIALNEQHEFGRYRDARHTVAELLNGIACGRVPAGIVWLAGHSLGASIALDVGRQVMEERWWCLPTFLFNPPHVSVWPVINKLGMAEKARRDLYFKSFMVKAMLAKTVRQPHERSMTELFERLAPWVPELYVHDRDFICQGFVDYFEQRQKMLEKSGVFQSVAEVAMKLSYRDMWTSSPSHDTSSGNGDEPRVQFRERR